MANLISEVRLDENGLILRPCRRDKLVLRRAAEMALVEVKGWLGPDSGNDEDTIHGLMKHIGGNDGFEIAKGLDNDGWNSDSRLVEILDADHVGDAERELVRQWVICRGIKLELPVGAKVHYRGQGGEVATRDEALAQYGVRTPDLKDGWRHICNCEDVQPIAEAN